VATPGSESTPLFMQRRSTDEYAPRAYSTADRRVITHTEAVLDEVGERRNVPAARLIPARAGTAAGLRSLNEEWGATFFDVPVEATLDDSAAAEVFDGPETVIDVQTHFLADRGVGSSPAIDELYRAYMPRWWGEMDDLLRRDLAEYVTNVFLETENAVAVLTSGPDTLTNVEMADVRRLVDDLAGPGRLLNHAVVHAERPEEIEQMAQWKAEFEPVGWKVYTPGRLGPDGWYDGWMLDDEEHGFPFLQRARDLDVKLICAHKGISLLVDNGSPRDIGPAARAFPDLDFVVYHSGYEFADPDDAGEGPYRDDSAHLGVNRLLRSVEEAGLGRGSNVYAELGTTWFAMIRRPSEAAHVLGKLIAVLGEDNVIWGTDSIWYGGAQPLLDAFRTFQIPDEMCEKYGYTPLSDQTKAKILGRNAARIYGIDLDTAALAAARDDLQWARDLVARHRRGEMGGLQ
jgi:predicted TIM-barrel fold metal-dependent hydrolase